MKKVIFAAVAMFAMTYTNAQTIDELKAEQGIKKDSVAAIQEIQKLSTYTSIHEIVKKEAESGFVAHKQTYKLKMSEVDTAD